MKDWKGTKGEWKQGINDKTFVWCLDAEKEGNRFHLQVDDLNNFSTKEELESNAKLIVDAGNTIQKCGLLPSELLEQNDKMLKFLNNSLHALNDLDDVQDWKAGANELINKINKQ